MKYVVSKNEAEYFELENPSRFVYLFVDKKCGAKDISGSTACCQWPHTAW